MKDGKMTNPREVLEQYRYDYSVCGKCKLCQSCHVQEIDHERFWRNCPSGTRFCFEGYYASGKLELACAIEKNEIDPGPRASHILYTCMLCGSCEEQCYGVKQLFPMKVTELLRERAARDGWGPPSEFDTVRSNVKETGNLLGPGCKRKEWADGLDLVVAGERHCDTLLFMGCQLSCRPQLRKEARSAARVLKSLDIDFTVLGDEERCCGSPLLELGLRDEFEAAAEVNIRKIKESGAGLVLTPCAHGAYVFKEEYAPVLPDVEFLHLSEFVGEALKERGTVPGGAVRGGFAYHDPCMLGRRLEVYGPPREILDSIPGVEVLEFPRSGRNALCCGAGGMAWWGYPDYADWVGRERLYEAEWIGAQRIVTACPQCQWMLQNTAEQKGNGMQVYGMWEIVAEALGAGEGV